MSCVTEYFDSKKDPVQKDIENIQNIVNTFEPQLENMGIDKEVVDEAISKIEELNEQTQYVIVFQIKNNTNPILSTTLHLPVDENFFNSVNVGDTIKKEELDKIQFDEELGNWTIIIKEKIIRE